MTPPDIVLAPGTYQNIAPPAGPWSDTFAPRSHPTGTATLTIINNTGSSGLELRPTQNGTPDTAVPFDPPAVIPNDTAVVFTLTDGLTYILLTDTPGDQGTITIAA